MHFYESSIITTKDGLQCQVYSNEHPSEGVLVKPKYIPTDRVESAGLPYRFIGGRKMNRLNLWADKGQLKGYVNDFIKKYPQYIYKSPIHKGKRLFFLVPFDEIERVFLPRKGLVELLSMPEEALDKHLKSVYDFIKLILKSGIRAKDLGVTYSTLMGHYSDKSDMNIVVYGKENYWKIMDFLGKCKSSDIRWKTKEEWLDFYKKRNRYKIFDKNQFLKIMSRKKSEGYFRGTLFVIFAVEKEEEIWYRWGCEWYSDLGLVKVEGEVVDNHSSVVRPGCYDIKKSRIIEGHEDVLIKKIVFYSRDYCGLAMPGEKIQACGILERVDPRDGKEAYYRVVVGYFDAYLDERREKEYLKTI